MKIFCVHHHQNSKWFLSKLQKNKKKRGATVEGQLDNKMIGEVGTPRLWIVYIIIFLLTEEWSDIRIISAQIRTLNIISVGGMCISLLLSQLKVSTLTNSHLEHLVCSHSISQAVLTRYPISYSFSVFRVKIYKNVILPKYHSLLTAYPCH